MTSLAISGILNWHARANVQVIYGLFEDRKITYGQRTTIRMMVMKEQHIRNVAVEVESHFIGEDVRQKVPSWFEPKGGCSDPPSSPSSILIDWLKRVYRYMVHRM